MSDTLQDGIVLLQKGDLEASQEIFQRLLQENPADAAAHLWLGNCYVLIGDLGKAKASFRTTIQQDDAAFKEEAQRQLRAIGYNRLMRVLMMRPPLRMLLLFALAGYLTSWGLRAAKMEGPALWVELVSVWGGLSLFFFWVLLILGFFIGNMAFVPDHHAGEGAVKSAKVFIGLCVIGLIPANLMMGYGVAVKFLAIFLNAFLLALLMGRGLYWMGTRFAGEADQILLGIRPTEENTPGAPDVRSDHRTAAAQTPTSSPTKSKKKKKKIKK